MITRPKMKWPVRPSIRLRLTLLYSGLFVIAGAGLVSVNYVLVRRRESRPGTAISIVCQGKLPGDGVAGTASGALVGAATPVGPDQIKVPQGCVNLKVKTNGGGGIVGPVSSATSGGIDVATQSGAVGYANVPTPADAQRATQQLQALKALATRAQDHTLHTLEVESALALALMAIASLGLGWLVAGRVLRPVHRITNTARRLSQETLHERINLDRPDDELKELADTFDAMLARLDLAFTSQRRFVANASHELRTPLAIERVLIDEALANQGATREELHAILEQLRANSQESEGLINALLLLARSERGIDRWVPIDLAGLTEDVVHQASPKAIAKGVSVDTDPRPAMTAGDPPLIERLIGNLIENGIRHNLPVGGWMVIATSAQNGRAEITVTNSGPVVDPQHLPALLEPFRRQRADRTSTDAGFGLGLSIVKSIVDAHAGRMEMTAPRAGGLQITVSLPAAPAASPDSGRTDQVEAVSRP